MLKYCFGVGCTCKLFLYLQTAQSKLQSVQMGTDISIRDASISLVTVDPNLFNGTGMI